MNSHVDQESAQTTLGIMRARIKLGSVVYCDSDSPEHPKDFFGRQQEKRDILRYLTGDDRRVLIVQGERRMGKTSMLKLIEQALMAVHQERFFVNPWVIIDEVNTVGEFFWEIVKNLPIDRTAADPLKWDSDTPFTLTRALEVLQGRLALIPSKTLVVIMDELDECLVKAADGERHAILKLIQRIANDFQVKFLCSMIRVPERLEDRQAENFVADARIFYLEPFSRNGEYEKMVLALTDRTGLLNDSDLSGLHREAGGWPFFTKVILWHLVALEQPLDLKPLEEALKRAALDTDGHRLTDAMGLIYRQHFDPDEQRLFRLLAERSGTVSSADLSRLPPTMPGAALRLVARHYLRDDNGRYDFQVKLLRPWYRHWRKTASLPADAVEPSRKPFRIAFSFASERDELVLEVATKLTTRRFKRHQILYYKWYEEFFARPDAKKYVTGLYRDESELVVVFACPHYTGSEWCQLELEAIRDLIRTRPQNVMLIRFHPKMYLPTLPEASYFDVGQRPPAEIAAAIIRRYTALTTA